MRILCDTNVLISALVFPGGPPDRIFRSLIGGRFINHTSPELLDEFRRVLTVKLRLSQEQVGKIVDLVKEHSRLVYPDTRVSEIRSDPDDNRVLECALAAQVHYIVSGDQKHLVSLKSWKGIEILNPRQFVLRFRIV